jgi:23S rRNA (uridine2552-2'-O)-methyltransferase
MVYHLKDSFFKEAKRQGYLARSIYKLEEINKRYQLIKKRDKVLDLGASPGSWLQYIAKVIGEKGLVLGIDINPLKWRNLPNHVHFWQRDILAWDCEEAKKLTPFFDIIVSDMAPLTTGDRQGDAYHSFQLADRALEIALILLKPQGQFMCKLLEGKEIKVFMINCRKHFSFIKLFKPRSSRSGSREIFLIGFKKIRS